MSVPLLDVSDVSVQFPVRGGMVRALDGVSLSLQAGETLAVVGESGCGKTTLARAILGLQPTVKGSIRVSGKEVKGVAAGNAALVGMVWQDPYASLDPRWTIERSVAEPLRLLGRSGDVRQLLDDVGLDPKLGSRFPHQLSGGQRQRAAIGRALALRPPLVICDEPTAALDLSIQAQILNLLTLLQESLGCSYLYISHDLVTVRFVADRVAVMYLGQVVETGPTEAIFTQPKHPYTKALLESAPDLSRIGRLPDPLMGEIPDPRQIFLGCRFESRCAFRQSVCRDRTVDSHQISDVNVLCNFPLTEGVVATNAGTKPSIS